LSASKVFTKLTLVAFILSAFLIVPAQQKQAGRNDGGPGAVEYKAGQVWHLNLFGNPVKITILALEDRKGRIVHVRIDDVLIGTCGDTRLTKTIEHIAFPEKIMRKSPMVLVENQAAIPDSYLAAYRQWQAGKKHDVSKDAMPEAIREASGREPPMICN